MEGVERVTEPVDAVGESPVWRAADSALYWVDIPARRIHRLDIASGRRDTWEAPEMVACIAFDRRGGLIAGFASGFFAVSLGAAGALSATALARPALPEAGMRFNDGRCDRQGRFWAGTMHMQPPAGAPAGALYRFSEAEGVAGPMESGLRVQNGLAWSPDGTRMYLSDSHADVRCIWVYDYDGDAGVPRNRRVFADMTGHAGRPDGAAIDADGCYWTCANDAGSLLRFTPEGRLDRALPLPVRKPTMCAFGGARLDTLFVTSIRPQRAQDLEGQPDAGAVFALRPGVRGVPESDFGALSP
jgi:sugar lactone lactonase YvrE